MYIIVVATMTNEPNQIKKDDSDTVFSTLVQLIASNPDSAQELSDVMMYIRSLESKCREVQPPKENRQQTPENNNSHGIDFTYNPPLKQTPHTYRWTETALREHPHGESKSHLQVSQEDYMTVADAIQSCRADNELITAADIGDATQKNSARKIPPTQMYLCIRFWRSQNLIARAGGRRLKIVDTSTPFSETAKNLIYTQ